MCINGLLKRNNEQGYTLLEAILQLSVLMLFSQIFLLTVGLVFRVESTVTNPTETEWGLFVYDVERYLNDVDEIHVQEGVKGIRFHKAGDEYDIELYDTLIRKQKNRLGHEQMLLHVKSFTTKLEGQSLKLSVEFANGIKKEQTFYVTFHSE
ncbi:competence protein ComGF [Psychrobacillus insolitus]|uniref:Competence protein ComGF n=1 Tax=Psychrobacillus insolitus TaxID=1461 RepID=A0A2W7PG76_9BACI|nr:competence type IV pilus minor pilin ComGF [Psychrobacillus insolitus]PZX07236.1 competence protein ComGF [Psychrobacillus insolitus]